MLKCYLHENARGAKNETEITMDLNNFDYGAEKRIEGPLKVRAFLILLVYAIYTGGFAFVAFVLFHPAIFALWPFGLMILHLGLWRFVKIDYIYHIEAGMLTLNRRYSNKKLVPIAELRLKLAELIAPKAESEGKIRDFEPEIIYDAVPSKDTKDVFVILYRNNENRRCAMYIEVSQASLKALHYYNSTVPFVATEK